MQVHLIDGTYELFRAFFGAPSATSPSGMEVGAVRGLLSSMISLLREEETTHVAVAFDHVIESFRNDLFDGYKTGEGLEAVLADQFPLAEEAMAALGVVVWPMVEFEADDALAAFAHRAAEDPRVERIWLGSPDKDLAQSVVDDRIVLLDRRRQTHLDAQGVEEKFGVRPEQIPDLLALVGDSADGIPGVPRWGMKSSAILLQRYQTLEQIPLDEDKWDVKVRGAASLAASLREHEEAAKLYKVLATLRRDVPLPESVDDLAWRGANLDVLTDFAGRIGMPKIIARVPPAPT